MWQDAHDAYLESRILSADPIELVKMLYQGCTGAVQDARRHLAAGEIGPRSRCIMRAYDMLLELTGSLNHEKGGDYSRRLAALYDYMQRRLIEANLQQIDPPLEEVLGLLTTLSEGWEGMTSQAQPKPAPAAEPPAPSAYTSGGGSEWSQPIPPDPSTSYVAQAWSL